MYNMLYISKAKFNVEFQAEGSELIELREREKQLKLLCAEKNGGQYEKKESKSS